MGVLLLLVGLAVLGFGLWNHIKGKRILAAPFKKTGDLARNPVSEDPKGSMSTEGKIVPPAQALLSPCTKAPCLYYEVKIERLYEKTESTEEGTKTTKGSTTLDTLKGGALFGLDDGSGVVSVDLSKGADFDTMKDGYKKELNGRSWSSNIQFGELEYDVPAIGSSDGYTIGFKATEKYVPADGSLFVLGKIEGGKIVKPGWRSMLASTKGREGLLGSVNKKKKFSFIGGGVAAVLSVPLMIFGPSVDSASLGLCQDDIAGVQAQCSANVSSKSGDSYAWNVANAGKYEVVVTPPSGKKFPLDAQIIVTDSTGEIVADKIGTSAGSQVKALVDAKAGTYTVVVKDSGGMTVKGGFSYDFEIRAEGAAKADGAGPAVAAAEGLDAAWAAEQLLSLNDLCGDTFCEGEFEYDFTNLTCAGSSCDLSFKADNKDSGRSFTTTLPINVASLKSDSDKDLGFFDLVSDALIDWEVATVSGKAVARAPQAAAKAPVKKPFKKSPAKKSSKRMSP